MTFTDAQELKFELFEHGLALTPAAADYLEVINDGRALTPADYASTTGVILRLDDEVWVNAPLAMHNPNFVDERTPYVLDHDATSGFSVQGAGLTSAAEFWRPPAYHGSLDSQGRPVNNYVFTHGDRVRLSPIRGCHFVCTFCNIPYEDPYATKPLEAMIEAIRTAVCDRVQPARHMLISGGTPSRRDVGMLRGVYERILEEFPELDVDIMMVPVPGLFDLPRLNQLGLGGLSINLEVFSEQAATQMMRQKHRQGRDYYLDFLAEAADELGGQRVRSMLMVGLEPIQATLEGVRAIAERGCVPVLSPFRPDPVTPLAALEPPSAATLRDTWSRAFEIMTHFDLDLGPSCPPCTHNTLTLVAGDKDTPVTYPHLKPAMMSGRP